MGFIVAFEILHKKGGYKIFVEQTHLSQGINIFRFWSTFHFSFINKRTNFFKGTTFQMRYKEEEREGEKKI